MTTATIESPKRKKWSPEATFAFMQDAIANGPRKAAEKHTTGGNESMFYIKRNHWIDSLMEKKAVSQTEYDIAKALFKRPKSDDIKTLKKLEAKVDGAKLKIVRRKGAETEQILKAVQNIQPASPPTAEEEVSLTDVLNVLRGMGMGINKLVEALSRPPRQEA